MIKSLITLCLLFIFLDVFSQASEERPSAFFSLGARYNYGFVIRHSKALPEETQSNPVGYQLDAGWHFIGEKARDYCNCYPRLGLSFYYWDYRNPDILGQGLTLMAFAEPFFKARDRLRFSARAGLGLNYQNMPYDSVNNPLNLAYSTHFAFAVLLNFNAGFRINEQWTLSLGINYNHISNGGVKLPNKGLNYPTVSLGAEYYFRKAVFPEPARKQTRSAFQPSWQGNVSVFLGFKGIQEDEELYFVKGLSIQGGRRISPASAFAGGLEYIYDDSELAMSRIYTSITEKAVNRLSGFGAYEFSAGDITFFFNMGIYLYSPDRHTSLLYQRYGFRLKIWRFLSTGLSLKAHGHVASFFDVRLIGVM
ncbi:MAG: acyloxyacyl hydrolase [Bacteroidetes bacterium]|nr:acyloxyacyl hydrolase [Bacteroidota bacterium]